MASATKRMVEKTRVVEEKYTEKDGVVLELDENEAFVLCLLLNRAGGSRSGPRGQLDRIRGALAKCGIEWNVEMSRANNGVAGYTIFPDRF
jgi:hypothetical protein